MNPMTQYPPRPVVTEDIIREAALDIANRLSGDVDDIVDAYQHPMDGYELGKALERESCWDIQRDDIDVLDEVGMNARRLLKEQEADWVRDNNIQPPYPVGTRVQTPHRGTGVIDAIDDYSPGCFLVVPDIRTEVERRSQLRWVCKFEEVEPASEAKS